MTWPLSVLRLRFKDPILIFVSLPFIKIPNIDLFSYSQCILIPPTKHLVKYSFEVIKLNLRYKLVCPLNAYYPAK